MNISTQKITNFDKEFSIVRNASVEVQRTVNHKGHTEALIIVADKYQHTFPHNNSVSQALVLGTKVVEDRLNGGTFFFHNKPVKENDGLVTFQDSHYNGFIHTDDSIRHLMDHIGFTTEFNKSQYTNTISKGVRLQNIRSNVSIDIPAIQEGGDLKSQLSFQWDPFQSHIRAVYQVLRMVCENGMMGMSDMMNGKIPMINNWEEHMAITDKMLQNKMTHMISHRMNAMLTTPASVRDCFRVNAACLDRRQHVQSFKPGETDRLSKIASITDPNIHLSGKVHDSILEDGRLSDQVASHLSQFAVWNLLTELASHTQETKSSTQTGLHKHANALLIDGEFKQVRQFGKNLTRKVFENPDAAFARDMIQIH